MLQQEMRSRQSTSALYLEQSERERERERDVAERDLVAADHSHTMKYVSFSAMCRPVGGDQPVLTPVDLYRH